MSRRLPSTHADTHRPPGTLGPDDPGGSDPIPADFGVGLGGIRFDTYPQDGDWLYVKTTGQADSPAERVGLQFVGNPYGILFTTEDDLGGGYNGFETLVAGDNNFGWILSVSGANNGGVEIDTYDDGNSGIKLQNFGIGSPIQLRSTQGAGIALSQTGDGFGINISDDSDDEGIQLSESGDGGITIRNFGNGEVLITAQGTGDITLQTEGDVAHGVTELYLGGTTGPEVYLGNADAYFGIVDAIVAINGQSIDDPTTINDGITLNPGFGNTYRHNSAVAIDTILGMATVTTEPVAPNTDESAYIYHYQPGVGNSRIKVYFPKTGTRTTLATA